MLLTYSDFLYDSFFNNHIIVIIFTLPAPSAPISLSSVNVPPSNSHGPRITLIWSEPAEPNGVINSYTLFYSHNGVAPREISGIGKAALSHTVDVLGGVTYQFIVSAVTIKPGKNATKTVTTKEYGKLYFHIFEMTSFYLYQTKINFYTVCKFKKQTVVGHWVTPIY